MPEHVHLLTNEPETSTLATFLQILKQQASRQLKSPNQKQLWQRRYYDFNLSSPEKFTEKLQYIHRNPVTCGLVTKPEDYRWSSYNHYATGEPHPVEIESNGPPATAKPRLSPLQSQPPSPRLSTLNKPQNPRVPHPSRLCEGWDANRQHHQVLAFPLSTNHKTPGCPILRAFAKGGTQTASTSKSSPFHSQQTTNPRVPILRAFAKGGMYTVRQPALFSPNQPKNRHSTKAVRGRIGNHRNVHKNHTNNHVSSMFLQSKRHVSSGQPPEETARQTGRTLK
jgi:hypothetical protein